MQDQKKRIQSTMKIEIGRQGFNNKLSFFVGRENFLCLLHLSQNTETRSNIVANVDPMLLFQLSDEVIGESELQFTTANGKKSLRRIDSRYLIFRFQELPRLVTCVAFFLLLGLT